MSTTVKRVSRTGIAMLLICSRLHTGFPAQSTHSHLACSHTTAGLLVKSASTFTDMFLNCSGSKWQCEKIEANWWECVLAVCRVHNGTNKQVWQVIWQLLCFNSP